MSRITNKNIQIGDSYVMPLEQRSISKYEAKVESILNEVEEEKKRLLAGAMQEAENIKMRAELKVKEGEQQAEEIINNAQNEASNIIKQAEEECEKIKADTDNIFKAAYNEGFKKGEEDGLAKFKEDSAEALKALDIIAESSFNIKQNIIESSDMDIVELVIAIARKVTSHVFDEKMLKEITISAIQELKNKENITIIVNPELIEKITLLSEEFKTEIPQLKNIKFIEDSSLSPDGTIVESPLSRIDGRLSSKIDEIAQKLINGIQDDVQEEE